MHRYSPPAHGGRSHRLLACQLLLLSLCFLHSVHALVPLAVQDEDDLRMDNWIDPETPKEFYKFKVPQGPYDIFTGNPMEYDLIFSDEFNDSKRTFEAGFDPKWTAVDIRDKTNMGQHYFLPSAVQVDKGNLIITTSKPKEKYRGAHYVSGSVQTWNKFCYTGGFVEVKAILPGKWGIPGTWPAIWIMGNLGRAAFTDSQDGKWPWSFDYCAPYLEKQQKKKQQISACGNLTDKHDPNSYPVNYGLNPYQGRGSTEIDVMEGQIRARDKPAFISTSLQITPSLTDDLRPASETLPGPGQWYQGLKYGNFTRINSDYYGENGLDAISALTQLESNAFTAYHLYQLDWQPGPDGHIRWWLDYNFLFEIPGSALNTWANNVPPRMIPVEPSYLILSTAVSEKFSPPCQGQICDSIWPSNFTIDYVRVYQGNPNNYTSIGCDPEAFPTQTWVYTHPVDYGLPWYVSLQLGPALTHLFAFLNLLIGAAIAFGGVNHAKSATFYTSSLLLVAGFYGVFNFVSADDLAWIQVFIACMSGIVIAGICALFPTYALGALLGLFASLLIGQFLPLVLARCLVAVLVTCGLCAPLCNIEKKHVVIFATSGLGALAIMTSLSYWFDSGDVAANVWELSGLFLGGVEPKSQHVCTGDECLLLYALFLGVAILGVVFQLYSTHGKTVFEVHSAKAKSTSISAGSDARAWCHQDESAHNDKSNYFSPDALPAHLRPFGNVIKTATNVQRTFGFQTTNLRNQAEHIIVFLANNSRKGANAYRALHAQVFGNYQNWCMKLRVEPLCWNESRPSRSGLSEVDEIAVDLCLFFFIWGEASNLRHVPESLCFLYHKMKQEYPGVRQTTREEGHFLDTVITPIYGLMRSQMGGNNDHIDRRTYDDFNEFFWDASCLEYDYKYEAVNEIAASPNPAFFQKHRSGFFQTTSRSNGPKSVAEKLSESCDKSFLEKRTWFASLRAFFRLFEFHVVSFHFLVALAFANKQEMNLEDALQVISSTLITPFVLHGLRGGLDIFSIYDARMATSDLVRHALLLLSHLCFTIISIALYWQALNFGGAWWATYYSTMLFLHLPGLFNSVLQIMPQSMNWLRRTHWGPVAYARDLLSPMNRLYVGDNVLDTASQSFGYYVFWITLLTWKLFFSYKFEIAPVVVPTFLLYADHVENNVGMLPTAFLIFLNWMPFFLVYCVDMTIWNSIWLAFTGTFVGFSSRIGEIRNFTRVRAAFARAADVFNAKLISIHSKTGCELHKSSRHDFYGSVSSIRGHEVLDQVTGDPATSSMKRTNGKSDQTPLLSFSRRKQTADEILQARRQKWISFSVAWDVVIDTMRADDLISNKEKSLLHFQRLDGYQREIYLPQFQLAGCFESFCNAVENVYSREKDATERTLQDALLGILGENVMFEEAVEEVWELARWVLINVLGPCHSNDVQFICSTLNSWASRGAFRALNLRKIGPFALALADLLSSLSSNLGGWKKNAKYIPVRKNPSDYSNYQFPQQQGLRGASSSGLTKSASTTGLSSLGGTVPRRSRGAGIGRIAAMQQGNSKPKDSKSKSGGSHVIPGTHLVQIRDKLRTFLNLGKTMLTRLDDIDNLQAESRGLSDRLTWILTQERGFFWDDEYAGEQLTLTAFEKHADVVVQHLHGLLTLQKVDAEPRSYDARRRLLFFVNSIFMDMPLAPLLEEMKSWSVMTPFYAEDVLYSKTDLESKRDGLDVHTLLFLQTVYQQDWENFIERVKPKKNLWKNPDTAAELRLWASLRGQTLARTVQGMMYGEAAIRLLAEIEQVPTEKIEELVRTKFTYVVACQVYGRQKRNNDPRAQDIEYLLHRFPNLRVAYIDEVRVNYQKEQSYFAVLIKGSETQGQVEEVYRIRLPGNPILGEGKPENQNAAIVFTRGEHLQTIDMNQDGYIEESLKMRNLLEEFDSGSADRPTTIVGLPEHIFTGSVSSLANYMALQETSFVTLGQRTLTNPLRVRMHYGHPDVFNKLFFITRGGISKASKGINLSEDIFAGYNNCLRGGTVAFPEYVKAGKGRDVGMQQIYKFEAKLAQGAAEQSLSRDVYRIAQRLDFFKLLSFYYNHVGFYLTTSLIIWTVYILLYCNIFRALMALEGVGGREPVLLSSLQVMLGCVAFFTTAPLMATISVERGFKAALKEVFMIVVTGGPFYFLFHIGTKWFYYGQTILAGGAKYRATGRGFVTKHSRFDELYRFYASSHLYSAVEIAFGLSVYWLYTIGHQYFAMTWSLWLVAFSWYFSPFWFNPLAFEWADVTDDLRVWLKWMRGTGGNPEQSWEAWFREENAYFSKLRTWAKLCIAAKGALYMCLALAILAANDSYHSLLHKKTWLPFALTFGVALVYVTISSLFFNTRQGETGLVRFLKSIWIVVCAGGIITLFMYVDGMFRCMLSMIYLAAAIASWSLLIFGATSRSVSSFYYIHDVLLGGVSFGFILLLSALYVPGKIQTWLLYNNALSRGVVIEDILRTNQGRDDQDDMSLHQMRDIIVEQQRVISALTLANGSDSGEEKNGQYHDLSAITHTLSDNALKAMRNVSETELTALQDASNRLSVIIQDEHRHSEEQAAQRDLNNRARRGYSNNDLLKLANDSLNDVTSNNFTEGH